MPVKHNLVTRNEMHLGAGRNLKESRDGIVSQILMVPSRHPIKTFDSTGFLSNSTTPVAEALRSRVGSARAVIMITGTIE